MLYCSVGLGCCLQPPTTAAKRGHSCVWPQNPAFTWSSPPAESLEESPAQEEAVWPAGLWETYLLGSHRALTPSSAKDPWRGWPKNSTSTELLHVGDPKPASWVQSIQCHLPLKLPSLRALKRMSWNQVLLHFAQQHSLDKKWPFRTSFP